jgi:hypothetical protein
MTKVKKNLLIMQGPYLIVDSRDLETWTKLFFQVNMAGCSCKLVKLDNMEY